LKAEESSVARQDQDKSSKWMIQHHADAMLLLGGLRNVRQWKAVQAELVVPRNLPDGLIEVYRGNRKEPDHYIIEVATYPEKRVVDQAMNNLMLGYQFLGKLPELLVLVLHPKGKYRVPRNSTIQSREKWSELGGRWNVVELWTFQAKELLETGNVGLIPWVPLTQFQGRPEALLDDCRRRIERNAPAKEQADLLAVSQVMARLRFPSPEMLALLGGKRIMIESPLIQELLAEDRQKAIGRILVRRFKQVPPELLTRLQQIGDLDQLEQLLDHAVDCPDLITFERLLRA